MCAGEKCCHLVCPADCVHCFNPHANAFVFASSCLTDWTILHPLLFFSPVFFFIPPAFLFSPIFSCYSSSSVSPSFSFICESFSYTSLHFSALSLLWASSLLFYFGHKYDSALSAFGSGLYFLLLCLCVCVHVHLSFPVYVCAPSDCFHTGCPDL